jgi:hypothetical protein
MGTKHLHPPHSPYQWPTMSMTTHAQRCLFGAMRDMGYDDDESRHALLADVLGGDTFTVLDDDDAWAIVAHLRQQGWWK